MLLFFLPEVSASECRLIDVISYKVGLWMLDPVLKSLLIYLTNMLPSLWLFTVRGI